MITDGSWTPKVHTQALVDDTRNSGKIEEICGLSSLGLIGADLSSAAGLWPPLILRSLAMRKGKGLLGRVASVALPPPGLSLL